MGFVPTVSQATSVDNAQAGQAEGKKKGQLTFSPAKVNETHLTRVVLRGAPGQILGHYKCLRTTPIGDVWHAEVLVDGGRESMLCVIGCHE